MCSIEKKILTGQKSSVYLTFLSPSCETVQNEKIHPRGSFFLQNPFFPTFLIFLFGLLNQSHRSRHYFDPQKYIYDEKLKILLCYIVTWAKINFNFYWLNSKKSKNIWWLPFPMYIWRTKSHFMMFYYHSM